jgi:glutamate-1-semialdehyde 2,1-aminomutase
VRFDRSRELQRRSHALIPGGAHTYAKGDDQYPVEAPGFLVRGAGCRVWDADGNEFLEYGMGLRAVTLGHGYGPVVEAATRALAAGTNFTRPAPLEVALAERLVGLIGPAEMAKFTKNGSDATTAAVKLARAHTGRDKLLYCRSHPFFSTDDWFIGTTPMGAGVPAAVRDLSIGFDYNDASGLAAAFEAHPGQIACVILEPAGVEEPKPGFLEAVRELCDRHGSILILDETITGFRWHLRGAQTLYGVCPDLSVFGKALGNGFAIAALLGRREVMRLGGLDHDRERVFLLSTTHGAETHALAAALAVIDAYEERDVVAQLERQGERLREGVEAAARDAGVAGHFATRGRPQNLVYGTKDATGRPSQAFRALFLQELIRRGVLAPSFVVSAAHDDAAVDRTIEAVAGALGVYRRALEDGVERHLVGRPVKPVWRSRN